MHALWKGMRAVQGFNKEFQPGSSRFAHQVYATLEHPDKFPAMMPEAEGMPTTWLCSISHMMRSSDQVDISHQGTWNFTTDDKYHAK
jgi:hypothetical protein